MLVNRRTFIVKNGCWEEAVAMGVAEVQRIGLPRASRLYVSEIGPFSSLVGEFEFESLAEYEAFWAEYFASPEGVAFNEKWGTVTESGGTNEIWRLVDLD
jgi:hypothetical protein